MESKSGLIGQKIGRVRVESLLGEGGMGKVYRGFDEKLERPVALKAIRKSYQMNARRKARFLREAKILSKLNHPGICLIYDLIDTSEGDYLVLEYIEGKTLKKTLEEGISEKQKLDLAIKIADVMAAAHQEGVVHRDLKPDNVMVTREGDIKVLDFGLARRVEDEPEAEEEPHESTPTAVGPLTLSQTLERQGLSLDGDGKTSMGAILGTLRYMSPEQALGKPLTEKTDLYSFGLLLQEMMTGQPVYDQDLEPIAVLYKVSQGTAKLPEGLGGDLTEIINELKSFDPAFRPTAADAAERLRFLHDKPLRQKQRRRNYIIAAAFLVVLVATAFFTRYLSNPPILLKSGQKGRVAFLPIANHTGDQNLDWVQIGLMDIVAKALDAHPQIQLIESSDVLQFLKNTGLTEVETWTSKEAGQIQAAFGTDFVITAALEEALGRYLLEFDLRDRQGIPVSGKVEGNDTIRMAEEMAQYLGQRFSQNGTAVAIRDLLSANTLANQLYAIGMHRFETSGPKEAAKYFPVCLDLDNQFLWAKHQLALSKARLSEWDESVRLTDEVFQEATIRNERKLVAASHNNLGNIAERQSRWGEAEAQYHLALDIFQQMGDREGQAGSFNNLANLAMERGLFQVAANLWQQALKIYKDLGDRHKARRLLDSLVVTARSRGDQQQVVEILTESLNYYRQIDDKNGMARCLANLGFESALRADWPQAESWYQEALVLVRQLGNRQVEVKILNDLAEISKQRGDLEAAERILNQARDLARQVGYLQGVVMILNGMGEVAEKKGELEKAGDIYRDVLQTAEEMKSQYWRAVASLNLAKLLVESERFDEAEEMINIAAPWFEATPQFPSLIADCRLVKARLLYQAGKFQDAWGLASKAKEIAGENWVQRQESWLRHYEQSAKRGKKTPFKGSS